MSYNPYPKLTERQIAVFVSKIDKSDHDGCWPWRGSLRRGGYGMYAVHPTGNRTRMLAAHRVAWELELGPIPEGLQVRHKVCHNPPCCRVDHLLLGTARDNSRDRDEDGNTARGERSGRKRHPEQFTAVGDKHWTRQHPESVLRGERHGEAKLTELQVREIKQSLADGELLTPLAEKYGVTIALIGHIKNGRAWTHVDGPPPKYPGKTGESHPDAKLKASDIPKIRGLLQQGITCGQIGKLYQVNSKTIYSIRIGKTWRHIP